MSLDGSSVINEASFFFVKVTAILLIPINRYLLLKPHNNPMIVTIIIFILQIRKQRFYNLPKTKDFISGGTKSQFV